MSKNIQAVIDHFNSLEDQDFAQVLAAPMERYLSSMDMFEIGEMAVIGYTALPFVTRGFHRAEFTKDSTSVRADYVFVGDLDESDEEGTSSYELEVALGERDVPCMDEDLTEGEPGTFVYSLKISLEN